MATNGDLTAGKGNGHKGAAGLVAAALGISLISGLVVGHARPAPTPAALPVSNPPLAVPKDQRGTLVPGARIWTGTCRAGGSDCLPDEEIVVPARPLAVPRGWTGTCRAGSSDCLPDEDILGDTPAGRDGVPQRAGPADEYVER